MPDMKRREFIALLGGGGLLLAAKVKRARGQQPAMPVIGFLNGASAWEYAPLVDAFRQSLGESGYFEGRNIAVEYRWAEGHYDRLPTLAADLVRRQVTVIAAAGGTQAAVVAKAATTAIPIVFSIGADPIAAGLVTSLNRPGGNLTGVVTLAVELGPKRLELAHGMVPAATSAALLVNPSDAAQADIEKTQEAARALGLQLHILRASSERELDMAFAAVLQLRAGALVINADAFSALGRCMGLDIDVLGHSLRKLRPPLAEQELRDILVPDRACSLWRLHNMVEHTGNGLSLHQIAQGHEGALPASPFCPLG